MSDRRSLAQRLREAERRLRSAGVASPRAEAELLFSRACGIDRAGLVARRDEPVDEAAARRFTSWVDRRAAREPFQHLTGKQEFRGLPFAVGPEALIPRPETEGLVDAVLALDLPDGARVADLGTGTGCIAIALAHERPTWRILALDLSAPALALARRNAECMGVADRVELVLGSMTDPPEAWNDRFDVVVSNPPYVAEPAWRELEPEVRDHEPRIALVAGPSGIEMYRAMMPAVARIVRRGGHVVLELGHDSLPAAREASERAGFDVETIRRDFAGIDRVLVARRRGAAPPPGSGEGRPC